MMQAITQSYKNKKKDKLFPDTYFSLKLGLAIFFGTLFYIPLRLAFFRVFGHVTNIDDMALLLGSYGFGFGFSKEALTRFEAKKTDHIFLAEEGLLTSNVPSILRKNLLHKEN